ncbi:MAG: helix-turn-helix domain-containing protein, partial [Chitinophagales bacterium]
MKECCYKNKKTDKTLLNISEFKNENPYKHPQHNEFYSCILITEGKGKYRIDGREYFFSPNELFFFTPFQLYEFIPENLFSGVTIFFHSDFFCLEKHAKDVGCNGVLFNNIYAEPSICVHASQLHELLETINKIKTEIAQQAFAQGELLISYLKIFLIQAVRIKTANQPGMQATDKISLQDADGIKLKTLIEDNFRKEHSPSEYAGLMNTSLKSLNTLAKKYFNKPIAELLQDRLVTEAKRELYLTNKTVKEIAYNIGFNDEYYFSR